MSTRFKDRVGSVAGTTMGADNFNSLDRGGNVWQSAVGGLFIDVSACRFPILDPWSVVTYAGDTEVAVTASQTNYVYFDAAGVFAISTSGFPAAAHIPLAEVACDGSTVTSITDRRFLSVLP